MFRYIVVSDSVTSSLHDDRHEADLEVDYLLSCGIDATIITCHADEVRYRSHDLDAVA